MFMVAHFHVWQANKEMSKCQVVKKKRRWYLMGLCFVTCVGFLSYDYNNKNIAACSSSRLSSPTTATRDSSSLHQNSACKEEICFQSSAKQSVLPCPPENLLFWTYSKSPLWVFTIVFRWNLKRGQSASWECRRKLRPVTLKLEVWGEVIKLVRWPLSHRKQSPPFSPNAKIPIFHALLS